MTAAATATTPMDRVTARSPPRRPARRTKAAHRMPTSSTTNSRAPACGPCWRPNPTWRSSARPPTARTSCPWSRGCAQEVAAAPTVSLETVKTHVGNVLTKLDASNRTHAVVLAYEAGLIGPVDGPDDTSTRAPGGALRISR
ncbi:helix-turn-helix transcriptional regulator [Streptomyces sp. ISL-11]|nr:helix-turn-helix transcriptional regulator [Streptomyces sp. ISL-11]